MPNRRPIAALASDHYLLVMAAPKMPASGEKLQLDRFKEMARELGCSEDEGEFEKALKRLTDAKHLPKHEPKKRKSQAD